MPTPTLGPVVRFSRPSAYPLKSLGIAGWSGVIGVPIDPKPRRKVIHFVRHAEGFHNVDAEVMKKPEGLDAQLTDEGKRQCNLLSKSIAHLEPDLIVTSPLTRTVQTALFSLPFQLGRHTPLVALEHVRETVNYLCDARRPLSAIVGELSSMGLELDTTSGCAHNHDEIWARYERKHGSAQAFTQHRESADLAALAVRARRAFAWLAARPEKEIVVVTHSAFLWNVLNMARVGKRAGVEAVCDYGGDFELEGWLSAKFDNCEMRTVVCDFPEEIRLPPEEEGQS